MAGITEILNCEPINEIEQERVTKLIEAMINNGWQGAPILYAHGRLITGSHRREALKELLRITDDLTDEQDNNINSILNSDEIGIDVSDIIDEWMDNNDTGWDDIDFADIGKIFEGTYIEEYKDDIYEW